MIYLSMFAISSFFIYIFEKTEKTNKVYSKIFLILGLSLPILLAALRDETVGIDISTYVKPLYNCALRSENFSAFLSMIKMNIKTREVETGFCILVYISTIVFKSLNGVMLLCEIFIIIPLYLALINIKKYMYQYHSDIYINYIWISMFCYYAFFYNNSLNQIRQAIACSFTLLFFSLAILRKYKVAIVTLLIASSMHFSAFVVIFIYVLFYLISKEKNKIHWFISIGIIFASAFLSQIFEWILKIGYTIKIIPEKYYGQIFIVKYNDIDYNFLWIIICIFMVVTSVMINIKYKNIAIFQEWQIISLLALCMMPVCGIYANFGRIVLYLLIYSVVIIPLVYTVTVHKIVQARLFSDCLIVIFGIAYWFVSIGLNDYTGTLVYKFVWS